LAALGDGGTSPCTAVSTQACLLDGVLAGGTKSGYKFAWTGDGNTPSVGYSVTGTPVTLGTTGQRGFFSNESGVIRADPSGTATVASAPLQ
jgi:type IV pilus assembly protein PilA